MRTLLLALLIVGLTGNLASAGSCSGNNSKHCRDARAAFAEHHRGEYPRQWYQGYHGRWFRDRDDWCWRNDDGREYRHQNRGWLWREAKHEHHHDYFDDRD